MPKKPNDKTEKIDKTKEQRLLEIEQRISELPKGNLTYKTINGKQQPYLQSCENGKWRTDYVKVSERERILVELEERRCLEDERELLSKYAVSISKILSRNPYIKGNPGTGLQDFGKVRDWNTLYVDKTKFIVDWWRTGKEVTLITRPRRFGKTLMLSTIEHFFSKRFDNAQELFDRLYISRQREFAEYMGQYPVIFLTFGSIKTGKHQEIIKDMCSAVENAYSAYDIYWRHHGIDTSGFTEFYEIKEGLFHRNAELLKDSVQTLCKILYNIYGKKTIILLDEYDTPMQEAYRSGEWDAITDTMRSFFNETFKANEYMERALITGITRVGKESLFSDMNQVEVHSVTSEVYSDAFGFTRKELEDILVCNDIEEMEQVKDWYDGFRFGHTAHIYNPWSVCCYLSRRILLPYWVDSGGYGLLSKILVNAREFLMDDLQTLLYGGTVTKRIDETITFRDLVIHEEYFWPLLLAVGGVTIVDSYYDEGKLVAELKITNKETHIMYHRMIESWFSSAYECQDYFCRAMQRDDLEYMNYYMNEIAFSAFSTFDVGRHPSKRVPENFYHGFVLGLIVQLRKDYRIDSNRESGIGRYDIMMKPNRKELVPIIIEFKVRDENKEKDLHETAQRALAQIDDRRYEQVLIDEGYAKETIRKYGFAFEGKTVLIER